MKYFYIIILFLAFIACNHKQQNTNRINTSLEENDSILVTYFCGLMETDVSIRCEKLAEIQERHPKNDYSYMMIKGKLEPFPVSLIDTFIIDSIVTNQIIRLLNNRVKADDYKGDARMYVTIKKAVEAGVICVLIIFRIELNIMGNLVLWIRNCYFY